MENRLLQSYCWATKCIAESEPRVSGIGLGQAAMPCRGWLSRKEKLMQHRVWRIAGMAAVLIGVSHLGAFPQPQGEKPRTEILKPDKKVQKIITASRRLRAQAKVVRVPGRDQPLLRVDFLGIGTDKDIGELTTI